MILSCVTKFTRNIPEACDSKMLFQLKTRKTPQTLIMLSVLAKNLSLKKENLEFLKTE